MVLKRTISGDKAIGEFYYPKPVIWIEGKDDVSFYKKVKALKGCVLRKMENSARRAELEEELIKKNKPIVIVRDGDYEILRRKRNYHRRIIFLRRYSIENYFIDYETVRNLLEDYLMDFEYKGDFKKEYDLFCDEMQSELEQLVVCDVACYGIEGVKGPLPKCEGRILKNQWKYSYDSQNISQLIDSVEVPENNYKAAKELVKKFVKTRPFHHLLRGHVVFGLVRRYLSSKIRQLRGRKVVMDNESFINICCRVCWELCCSDDHQSLKRQLSAGIREVRKMNSI